MQVQISARHGHLSEEHQAQVREKAEKLLHYFDRLTFIDVTVDFQKSDLNVEVIAKCEHKHEFVAHHRDADLLTALHGTIDKIKQQIKHYKEKLQDHRGDPAHNNGGHRP